MIAFGKLYFTLGRDIDVKIQERKNGGYKLDAKISQIRKKNRKEELKPGILVLLNNQLI